MIQHIGEIAAAGVAATKELTAGSFPAAIGGLAAAEPASAPQKLHVHVIDRETAMRARTFRMMTSLGVHCEIYGSIDEMIAFRPSEGIVLMHEYADGESVTGAIAKLRDSGLALSVAGCSEQPGVARVVAAMKAGALDYLALPFDRAALEATFRTLAEEDGDFRRMHAERILAASRVKRLSGREREVLDLVATGRSNKEIGRAMGISPRTVEIHRTKMMAKLGATNATDVVRNWYLVTQV
jgi:hypothetical protein